MSTDGGRYEVVPSSHGSRQKRYSTRRDSSIGQGGVEFSHEFGQQPKSTRQVMEMAHQQKYVLNALFKKNQLFQEREKQARNIQLY